MEILSNSTTTNHGEVFVSLCRKADEIVMASPFCYSDFTDFADTIASFSDIHRVVFVTSLKTEEVVRKIDALISFRNEMKRINVQWELRADNHLHGKIYIFKNSGQPFAGIITSANLTNNGMAANHEWGCLIEDEKLLEGIEQQVLKDAPDCLTDNMLDEIKKRAMKKFPEGVKNEPSKVIEIDDILHPYRLSKETKVFIKPIGVSNNPIYEGDFSKKEDSYMYFSKKRPSSVSVGDILIAYAVGGRKIMGVYKVTSEPMWDEDGDPRWPWYVESENLTPELSNCKWTETDLWVTGIANRYAETYNKPVTHNGGMNLGALNYGSDKIRLDDEYGQYLLSKVMDVERRLKKDGGEGR